MLVLVLVASVRNLNRGLMVSALPGQFSQHSLFLFPQKGLSGIVRGGEAVEGDPPLVGTGCLAVGGTFGNGFGGEACLGLFAGFQFDDLGAEAGAAETTC